MNRRQAAREARQAAESTRNTQATRMLKKGYLTVAEAARAAAVSIPRIYQLLGSTIEDTREGSRRYVKISSLLEHFPHAVP